MPRPMGMDILQPNRNFVSRGDSSCGKPRDVEIREIRYQTKERIITWPVECFSAFIMPLTTGVHPKFAKWALSRALLPFLTTTGKRLLKEAKLQLNGGLTASYQEKVARSF